jgi:hypothetical protein
MQLCWRGIVDRSYQSSFDNLSCTPADHALASTFDIDGSNFPARLLIGREPLTRRTCPTQSAHSNDDKGWRMRGNRLISPKQNRSGAAITTHNAAAFKRWITVAETDAATR